MARTQDAESEGAALSWDWEPSGCVPAGKGARAPPTLYIKCCLNGSYYFSFFSYQFRWQSIFISISSIAILMTVQLDLTRAILQES